MKKAIQIALKDLRPNPFKKFIREGKTDPEKVEKLVESMSEPGEFWLGLMGRPVGPDGKQLIISEDLKSLPVGTTVQICFGHNRLEAAIQKWGSDKKIRVELVNFTNGEMLQMLALENEGRATTLFEKQERYDLVEAARKWLTKHPEDCRQVTVSGRQRHQHGSGPCISSFLREKNYPQQRISEWLSQGRPEEPVPLASTEIKGNHGQSETPILSILSDAPITEGVREGAPSLTTEVTPVATPAEILKGNLAEEERELAAEAERKRKLLEAKGKTGDDKGGDKPTKTPPTDVQAIANSLSRLEGIYVKQRGMSRVAFVKAIESYLDNTSQAN
jgi:hypothetical protein